MNDSTGAKRATERCPTIETLRAFAIGQLDGDAAVEVAAHLFLHHCQRCGGLLLTIPETTASTLAHVPAVAAPDDHERPTDDVSAATSAKHPARHANGYQSLRLGRYVIQRQVGKGGFGTVYAARDEELDRLVAVKVPFADRLTAAEQKQAAEEARLHASLDHPNIVPVYDVGHTADIPFYFVSKLIAGQDLAARIKDALPDFREAARLVLLLAGALEHMHNKGLVHRDVKPRNVLLDEAGTPYLADFGLAMHPLPAGDGAAEDHLIAGTLAYMSPEQARGELRGVDRRTDVYALGVLLYELLTGEKPFRGGTATLRHLILNEEPAAPRALVADVPRDLEAICLKAMAKDPRGRYQTAGLMAEDLRRFLAGEPLAYGRRVGLPERVWSRARRHWPLTVSAGVAVLAVIAAWLFALRNPPSQPIVVVVEEKSVRATVQTDPPGARVSYFPLDRETGEVRPDKVVRARAGEVVDVIPGHQLVVVVLDGPPGEEVRFHEVFRLVPGSGFRMTGPFVHQSSQYIDGVHHLHEIRIPPADVARGMCLLPATDEFLMGSAEMKVGDFVLAPPHLRRVPAFYLDTTEVTVAAYNEALKAAGPGFAPNSGQRDHPAKGVRWDQAAAWAERRGKRLPDEAEYEYAATACGRTKYPWGDELPGALKEKQWTFGPVGEPGYDRLTIPGQPDVFGLYSNVTEWTSSWPNSFPGRELAEAETKLRVLRGGPFSAAEGKQAAGDILGPRERFSVIIPAVLPGIGFRCARSARPRWNAEDFVTVLKR